MLELSAAGYGDMASGYSYPTHRMGQSAEYFARLITLINGLRTLFTSTEVVGACRLSLVHGDTT